jgi:hypothetical protein
MTSDATIILDEIDPDKKDYAWVTNCVSVLRISWRQLKNVTQALNNRAIMYSMQPLHKIKESFDDEWFKENTDFLPVPVLEPIINSLVEDMIQRPPKAELRAEDITALNEKKQDLALLTHRGIIEKDRTALQQSVFGQDSQYKLPYDKFNGNVQKFDEMGLNPQDPDDVNFYAQNYQRLWYEIGGQRLINSVLKTNQFDKSTLTNLVKDVFWAKAICTQPYVDQVSGEIKYKYIDPQICWGIFGQSNDGKDDVCRGWQDSITVIEFMRQVGDDFDFKRKWKSLLWAINYCNNQRFTGFIRSGISYDCCGDGVWMDRIGCSGVSESALLDWSNAYKFKVFCGYIEWKTWEATSTKIINKNDSNYLEFIPYNYELKKKQKKDGYDKQSKLRQQWYSTYFLATSTISQYCYKFQKVYYQQISGVNDEYSNGTLCYYQEQGKSAVEIAKVYIDLINFCYYRLRWIISKAQPDKEEFVWEEMVTLAKNVKKEYPQQNGTTKMPALSDVITNLVKEMKAKQVRFRTYAEVNGKPVLNIPPIEKHGSGGVDPIAMTLQAIMQWGEMQIASKIGVNPMRLGANPPSRESTASENRTLEASYATTGYMYRMIQYLKEHLAIVTLNYATDILQYKDTLPYNWIQTLIGTESFEALGTLGKFCAHRYGLFIEDYNDALDKQNLLQAANIALQQKTLTITQWGIIVQNEDPKLGFKILAYLELKAQKRQRQQALQDMQIQDKMADKAHGRKMDEIKEENAGKLEIERERTRSYVAAAQINKEGKIETKELQVASEAPKIEAKTQSQKELESHKADLQQQEPFPTTTSPKSTDQQLAGQQ